MSFHSSSLQIPRMSLLLLSSLTECYIENVYDIRMKDSFGNCVLLSLIVLKFEQQIVFGASEATW